MIASHTAVPLDEAREEAAFGGKAVGLGAAVRVGLPVPRGFAHATELVEALEAREPAATAALLAVRASLDGPLAVRSSCVGEDSARASFAGQHQTRLGVRTPAQLVDAVDAVRESGHSDGALAYRRRHGLRGEPRMGVVIQELVQADVAGVMFTRNPVTGAYERVIEAARGLGEAVVQGLVTPDTYRVSRGGEVLERIAGYTQPAIHATPDGSTASSRSLQS